MTFNQIMSELKTGKYRPIYFLMGDESYFIDKITDYISHNALPPEQHAFNQIVMYGKDINVAQIDNTARRFPMMSDRMVVIIKEAQNIKSFDNLVHYAQRPLESTILVINYKYKTLDKRKKFYKEAEKTGIVFESKKLYENQIPDWITKYIAEKNFTIDPVATKMLVAYLGTDIGKVANELDKLIISLKAGTKILPIDIEQNIGISKDYNVFELQNALISRDALKANRIVKHFSANPKNNPFVLTISSLFGFFSKVLMVHSLRDKSKMNVAKALKVNPYFADNYLNASKAYNLNKLVFIISILREYDLKSKGVDNVSMTEGELLKEMVFKILH
ncbi:MAG: DNA polymerase III subunit delta [Bacteroidales bacterium]|nr:DNA polymerase III subunit delta [Bacteroidales bacterium]